MQNAELTQHIILIEERLKAIEAALMGGALSLVAQRLKAIDGRLALLVPASEERQHITDSMTTAEQIDELAKDAPIAAEQLASIVTTLGGRMTDTELRDALENTLFITQQLSGIMQGTRTDIVQMRGTLLRLSALLDQVLRARVADEEWEKSGGDRRREGERRKASGF